MPDSPLFVGHYRLTTRIGTGGMAEVFAGRPRLADDRLGPMVAVKRLFPHLAKDPHVVRMFLNEARITAQIDHPNVVHVLDVGQHDGEPYIAMELLEGQSLAAVRARAAENGKRVPIGITLRILTEACRGLDAAHRAVDEQGRPLCIVHRDFTPDNIHVGVTGEVKVIDFGIAQASQWPAGTEPGTMKGKFFYISPEMIAGRALDHRADLFAAGVMLYESLCGHRPFTGQTPDEVVRRTALGRPRRPTELDPSVPQALEDICLKALRQRPEDRFPSLQEFIDAIGRVGGHASLATREQVAQYLSALFPPEADPRRKLLQRARQIDPSMPGQLPANASADAVPPPPPLASARSSAPSSPPPPAGRARLRRALLPVALSGVLAVLALAGLALYLGGAGRPTLAVAQRLERATAAASREEREAALYPLGSDPGATEADLARGIELLLETGADQAALSLAERLRDRFPDSKQGALLEGRVATRLRLGRRAELALEKAAELDPSDPTPDLLRAELSELQGDIEGALAALTRAVGKAPAQHEARQRRGLLLSAMGRLDEASQELERVLAQGSSAEATAELGFVRFRQGAFEDALALLRRATRRDPRSWRGQYYLGAVLYRRGDIAGAVRAYRAADDLSPEDPRALVALCTVLRATASPELRSLEAQLSERFPDRSAGLLSLCRQ